MVGWSAAHNLPTLCGEYEECSVIATASRSVSNRSAYTRSVTLGFEVHERSGKPRRYEWCEIDKFMLVESRDDEVGLVPHVGLRFSPEHRRTLADKLWLAPRCHHDAAYANRHIGGYWDGPFGKAVDLMNEWLTRYKAARDLESR
jgi:hypothetical protein